MNFPPTKETKIFRQRNKTIRSNAEFSSRLFATLPSSLASFNFLADTDNVDRYIADELCGFTFTVNGFQTLFELIRRLQKQENLEKVPQNLPILMVSGAEDPVGDYGKGVHKACNSLKRAGVKNITVKLYENDRHELLNEDDAETAMEDIWQWICKEVPGIA